MTKEITSSRDNSISPEQQLLIDAAYAALDAPAAVTRIFDEPAHRLANRPRLRQVMGNLARDPHSYVDDVSAYRSMVTAVDLGPSTDTLVQPDGHSGGRVYLERQIRERIVAGTTEETLAMYASTSAMDLDKRPDRSPITKGILWYSHLLDIISDPAEIKRLSAELDATKI